jgi:hypothetical protein
MQVRVVIDCRQIGLQGDEVDWLSWGFELASDGRFSYCVGLAVSDATFLAIDRQIWCRDVGKNETSELPGDFGSSWQILRYVNKH